MRAARQAVVWNGNVWFFGGYTKKETRWKPRNPKPLQNGDNYNNCNDPRTQNGGTPLENILSYDSCDLICLGIVTCRNFEALWSHNRFEPCVLTLWAFQNPHIVHLIFLLNRNIWGTFAVSCCFCFVGGPPKILSVTLTQIDGTWFKVQLLM